MKRRKPNGSHSAGIGSAPVQPAGLATEATRQTVIRGAKQSVCIIVVGLAFVSSLPLAAAQTRDELVSEAVERTAPAVVRIRIIGGTGGERAVVSSQTVTGVAISSKGDIITSSFGFTEEPAAVFVIDAKHNRVAAKVVATDFVRKLVLLKCDGGSFQPAEPANEQSPSVGQTAIALGRFYDTELPTVSVGIVSAIRRIHGLAVQTDAKISPVNYGGPLVGLDGRVMGILVPLSPQDTEGISAGVQWYDSGIGFCIPFQDAIDSAKLLSEGVDRHHGLMGVSLSTRNPLATDFQVVRVHPDSPAEKAGLRKNDVILKANGVTTSRFGLFQSVVKRSYAGDQLHLEVQRGAETLETDMTLAKSLKVFKRGELGLIPINTADKQDGLPDGVLCHIVPDSPLAAELDERVVVVSGWNDEKIDTMLQLKQQLAQLTVGQKITLELRPATAKDSQSVAVEAADRTAAIRRYSSDTIQALADLPKNAKWTQSVEQLDTSEDKVWFYAPEVSPEVKSGLIVLLNRSERSPESSLREWEDTCRTHNLILAIIQPKDKTPLSREHVDLVRESLRVIAKGRSIDTDRLVLVAESGQADLCTDVLLNRRAVGVRSAVFIECRPQTSGISQEIVSRKRISTLFVQGSIQSRQSLALQRQAVTTLIDAGADVVEIQSPTDEAVLAERIAMWAINAKVR